MSWCMLLLLYLMMGTDCCSAGGASEAIDTGLPLTHASEAASVLTSAHLSSASADSDAVLVRRTLRRSAVRTLLQVNRTNEQFLGSNTSIHTVNSPPIAAVRPGGVPFDLPPDQLDAVAANTTAVQVKAKKRFPLILILAIVVPVTVVLIAGIALLCVRGGCCACADKVDPEDLVPPPAKKQDTTNAPLGAYAVDLKSLMKQREVENVAIAEVHPKSPNTTYSRLSSMKDTPSSTKCDPSYHDMSEEMPIPARTSYFATAHSHASLNSHRSSMDGTNDLHSAPHASHHGYESMSVRSSTAPSIQSQDEDDMSAIRRRESLRVAFEMALKPLDEVMLGTRKMGQKSSAPGLPKPAATKSVSPEKTSPVKPTKPIQSARTVAAGPSSSSASGSSSDTKDSTHSTSRPNRRAGKEPRRTLPQVSHSPIDTPVQLTINPTLLDSNLSQQRTHSNTSTLSAHSAHSTSRRDALNAFNVNTTSSHRLDAERTQSPTNLDARHEFLNPEEGVVQPDSPSTASDSSFASDAQKPPGLIEPSSPQGETNSDSSFSPRSECNTAREVPLAPVQGTEPQMIAVPKLLDDSESEQEEEDDGQNQYEEGQSQYDEGLSQYEGGQSQYGDGQSQYDEGQSQYDDLSLPTKVSDGDVCHVDNPLAVMHHTGSSAAVSMRMSTERLPERTHRDGRRDNIRQSWPQEGPSTPIVPGERAAALAGHVWETRKSRQSRQGRNRAVFATSDNESMLSERDSVRSSTEQWLNRNDTMSLPHHKQPGGADARASQHAQRNKTTEDDDPDTSTDNFTMNFSDDDDDMEVDVASLTVRPVSSQEVDVTSLTVRPVSSQAVDVTALTVRPMTSQEVDVTALTVRPMSSQEVGELDGYLSAEEMAGYSTDNSDNSMQTAASRANSFMSSQSYHTTASGRTVTSHYSNGSGRKMRLSPRASFGSVARRVSERSNLSLERMDS